MKAKTKTSFVCQECGYDSASWFGKCPECGAWNSFKEIKEVAPLRGFSSSGLADVQQITPQNLDEIASQENPRIRTNFEELNTVLGGGIVLGSVSLIAGDP